MLSKEVIAKCLKDTVLECQSKKCIDCKYYKDETWCLVEMQTDKIYEEIKGYAMDKKQINDMLKAERKLAINNYLKIVIERLDKSNYFSYLDKVYIDCMLRDCVKEIIND